MQTTTNPYSNESTRINPFQGATINKNTLGAIALPAVIITIVASAILIDLLKGNGGMTKAAVDLITKNPAAILGSIACGTTAIGVTALIGFKIGSFIDKTLANSEANTMSKKANNPHTTDHLKVESKTTPPCKKNVSKSNINNVKIDNDEADLKSESEILNKKINEIPLKIKCLNDKLADDLKELKALRILTKNTRYNAENYYRVNKDIQNIFYAGQFANKFNAVKCGEDELEKQEKEYTKNQERLVLLQTELEAAQSKLEALNAAQ